MALEVGDRFFDGAVFADNLAMTTTEDLTIPIDYDDVGGGSVGDPPAGTVFVRQSDIDDLLTANGWTAFKHLELAYACLPSLIIHEVIFNLAGGIHRPQATPLEPSTLAWLTGKRVFSQFGFADTPRITITGPLPSSYRAIVGTLATPLTINVFNDGTTDQDPWIEFVGTPFTGFDIRGRHIILDTGQDSVILKHDNSKIWAARNISPVPVSGFIGSPAARLKNGPDAGPNQSGITRTIELSTFGGTIDLEHLSVEPVGGNGIHVDLQDSEFHLKNFIVDHLTPYQDHGILPNGAAIVCRDGQSSFLDIQGCGYLGPLGVGGNDGVVWAERIGRAWFRFSYFGGADGNINIISCNSVILGHCGFEQLGANLLGGVIIQGVDRLRIATFVGSKLRFMGQLSNSPALNLSQVRVEPRLTFKQRLFFENLGGPGLQLGSYVEIAEGESSSFLWLEDGGGNLDVGLDFIGIASIVKLDPLSDVTGTNGDVRMADGSINSYTDIVNNGPLSDGTNVVEKA